MEITYLSVSHHHKEANSMPDSQHLDLLKQGVFAWNQWRQEHPEIMPDLNGTDMTWAHLSRIDLSGANLSGADFTWADLYKADLTLADLSGANLSGADLSGANLYKANLHGANLKDTQFYRADLREANLHGVNLHKAAIDETVFSDRQEGHDGER
jgi:uncharacterized protein YjbI with pentapeptide repeats